MPLITKMTRVLLFLFLLIGGAYFSREFLLPVFFSALLAMLMLPVCSWLERKGINRALAAIACVLSLMIVLGVMVTLLTWQISGLTEDLSLLTEQLNQLPGKVLGFMEHTLGMNAQEQQQMIQEQKGKMIPGIGKHIAGIAELALVIPGTILLVLVYMFLFIYFRKHLQQFALKLIAAGNRERAEQIIASSGDIAQKYISGLAIMIATLWVMYGIGFSIVGVRHALFFAVLCGVLEIVPYVGNLTGSALTALMALSHGGPTMALFVLLVYGIVQLTQTYLLEPMVVGAKVSINPLCTIAAIILGEMIWGVAGMVLAIPVTGIVKIICDNVDALKPFGFLLGEVKERKARGKK